MDDEICRREWLAPSRGDLRLSSKVGKGITPEELLAITLQELPVQDQMQV